MRDARERLALDLLDALWRGYRARVPYARTYERLMRAGGGSFINDHVAFRTLACQSPAEGLSQVARPFEALGYAPAGAYVFPEKRLSALHFRHPNPRFPKLFVSELKVWELPPAERRAVLRSVRRARPGLTDGELADIRGAGGLSPGRRERLLKRLLAFFRRPWPPPRKADVLAVERVSQYAAWTLLFGREVNHFTASVDSQRAIKGIERTVFALRRAGVPMKAEIEGRPGSRLRQSATETAPALAAVREGGRTTRLPWGYAYFELAERGLRRDPETGRRTRFEGFLGGQAANLFEMTRRR